MICSNAWRKFTIKRGRFIEYSLIGTLLCSTMAAADLPSSQCVILLHGLARTDSSMKPLERSLKDRGYQVINQGYPSTDETIKVLASSAVRDAVEQCPGEKPLNFVTHSMGGILVRHYLSSQPSPNIRRVVMLGPPNKGSEVVDKLSSTPGYGWINGPAGMQLGTGAMSVPNSLGAVNFDLGIIAGSRSVNPILSGLIPGNDDGKVSVENTKIDGMNAHITMPVTHTFMMRNKKVIAQVLYYLEHGQFEPQETF